MSEFVDIGRAKRMSKKADTPDCECGWGLRKHVSAKQSIFTIKVTAG